MTSRMLIDARHPEETRVVVVKGTRIEEFDFEAASRKQIKGNIYLAKVTRVEPSLQAAFIDYGGNRHGFLAFSEIHPDYWQIPREDREALLREVQQMAEETNGEREEPGADAADTETVAETDDNGQAEDRPEDQGASEEAAAEALRRRRMALRPRYKIQDVIRRRQVMLVQVVKEERGNKGAALTTYISLAGRYGVLMPNTAQGGGISRKIANAADRKRLKSVIAELNLPPSMGAIIRTAGLSRTKTEIRRDFDYLTRLWDEIRERTLQSTAPTLIYEDNDLLKRAIRDIYTRDIEEILVDGEAGYRQARAFMKLLMPSHAKKVQAYQDPVPLFLRAGVEGQLAAMMNPVVQLKSGGYMVISPTEALVAVDVNSGRATREHNIEETALRTNIEAAEEIARQIRLRDMAGLIVVDFIDMEVAANNRKVEKALKDALKADRARVQVGRISPFGLLEMSRQRLRTGVLEASSETCPHCGGSGLVRTRASAALAALRLVEEEAAKGRASQFRLRADPPVAVYILNRKRHELAELEARYGIAIEVAPDPDLTGARIAVDTSGPPPQHAPRTSDAPATAELAREPETEHAGRTGDDGDDSEATAEDRASPAEDGREGKPRRRRRRRGGRNRRGRREASEPTPAAAPTEDDEGPSLTPADAVEPLATPPDDAPASPDGPLPRPRRIRNRAPATAAEPGPGEAPAQASADRPPSAPDGERDGPTEAQLDEPGPRRRGRAAAPVAAEPHPPALPAEPLAAQPPEDAPAPAAEATDAPSGAPMAQEPPPEPRRGWWQRTFGG